MISAKSLFLYALVAPLVAATTYDVTVGSANGSLTYSPEAIFAVPGDQVVFHFQQKNHTATQSSFSNPCGALAGGFDSGFNPVAADVTDDFPTFTVTVNNTDPIWVYCRQAANTPQSHCGQGMVFAVNCGADGTTNSFTNFKNAALAIGAQLKAEAASSSVVVSPISTPTPVVSAPPTVASAAPATTHTVIVGGNGTLSYSPNTLSAQVNDVVVFEFQAKNHTVTQSSFNAPCEKLQFTSNTTGFDSGFMAVAADASQFPAYSITINDTKPVWAYCRQTGHCGQGMVMAINSNESSANTFAAFSALAMKINGTTNSTSSTSPTSNGNGSSSGSAAGASQTTLYPNSAQQLGTQIGLALGAVASLFVFLF